MNVSRSLNAGGLSSYPTRGKNTSERPISGGGGAGTGTGADEDEDEDDGDAAAGDAGDAARDAGDDGDAGSIVFKHSVKEKWVR